MSSAPLAALVLLLATASALDPHQLELKQHYEHLAYIADFPCLHPQPKVISVHKLFTEEQAHGKAYFPDVTVLHRCDECTGSCTSGHTCSPKTSHLALLPFKATYLHDTEKHKQGSWQMEYHELLNHTECACAVLSPHDSCHNNLVDSSLHKRQPSDSSSSLVDIVGGPSSSRRPVDSLSSGSSSSGSSFSSGSSLSSGSSTDIKSESTTRDYLAELFERSGS